MIEKIEVSVQQGEIAAFDADVVALKYARTFYGADGAVADALSAAGIAMKELCPEIGSFRYVPTAGAIRPRNALFVGVPDLSLFNYPEIREFGASVLRILSKVAPSTVHLVTTIHGPGYGLHEGKAFLALCRGLLDAVRSEALPPRLRRLTILDRNEKRVGNLRSLLEKDIIPFVRSFVLPYGSGHPLPDPGERLAEIPTSTQQSRSALGVEPQIRLSAPLQQSSDAVHIEGYQVFLSFKDRDDQGATTRDSILASEVFDFLSEKGVRVFFSPVSLEMEGISSYGQAIDEALDRCQILIAVGTSGDNLDSQWVSYEWSSFINEIRSGTKPHGRVFVYADNVPVRDLPFALRQTTVISHAPDGMERLYRFVANALRASGSEARS